MKTFIQIGLCAALAVLVAACSPGRAPDTQLSEATPAAPAEDTREELLVTAEDGAVFMQLRAERTVYRTNEKIPLEVTLTNRGETPVFYVKGSGSNVVPDALRVRLGNLAPMFRPEIMTFDYRIERLEPGASVTFSTPFAPFIPRDDRTAFGIDPELDLFETDEFERAQPGLVEGGASFTYAAAETADAQEVPAALEESPATLELTFSITLVA